MRRALLYVVRALRLRCAACGGGPIISRWFQMPERCPGCGLRLEREEGYFTGALAMNLVGAEVLFALGLVASFVATWPEVPGAWIYALIPLMVIAPLAFYPFSKTLWLAFDLLFRPVQPEAMHPQEAQAAAGRPGPRR